MVQSKSFTVITSNLIMGKIKRLAPHAVGKQQLEKTPDNAMAKSASTGSLMNVGVQIARKEDITPYERAVQIAWKQDTEKQQRSEMSRRTAPDDKFILLKQANTPAEYRRLERRRIAQTLGEHVTSEDLPRQEAKEIPNEKQTSNEARSKSKGNARCGSLDITRSPGSRSLISEVAKRRLENLVAAQNGSVNASLPQIPEEGRAEGRTRVRLMRPLALERKAEILCN